MNMKMTVTFVHKTLGPFKTDDLDATPDSLEKWEKLLSDSPSHFIITSGNKTRIFGKDILKEGYFIIEKTWT